MSNHLAIATVSATLQSIVQEAIQKAVSGSVAVVGCPRQTEPAFVGCYLYLLKITPNAALRNNHVPTRAANGDWLQRPEAALDLTYVIAFYSEKDLASERMAGSVVSQFNKEPVLTRAKIREVVQLHDYLAGSTLAEQAEMVKATPVYLSLEELSKLWTVFFQVTHRICLVYDVSVVLIDSDVKIATPPSVRTVNPTIAFTLHKSQ